MKRLFKFFPSSDFLFMFFMIASLVSLLFYIFLDNIVFIYLSLFSGIWAILFDPRYRISSGENPDKNKNENKE